MFGPECAVEYWHMGATKTLLRRITSRIFRGVNKVGVEEDKATGTPGLTGCLGVKYGACGAALFSTSKLFALAILSESLVTQ